MSARRVAGVLLTTAALFLSGCEPIFGPDDGKPPPPDRLAGVEAACRACTVAQATHPCPPVQIGGQSCSGIPPARVGETMILCAQGFSGSGALGPLEWHSSDPEVASVTPAHLAPIHCLNERGNAVLEAKGVGTAIISVNERLGNAVVRTVSAGVTGIPSGN